MRGSEVSISVVRWSVVKCSEVLQCSHVLSGFFYFCCLYGCMFCTLLFNSVSYVFLLLCLCILIVCKLCSVYSVLPWLRFFRTFSSVVRQMPGYNSQRRDTVRTLPNYLIVLFCVLFVLVVLFYVLFVCKCVLYYCHWVSTQLQLNISCHIISYVI
jgi:hypothetical protein